MMLILGPIHLMMIWDSHGAHGEVIPLRILTHKKDMVGISLSISWPDLHIPVLGDP